MTEILTWVTDAFMVVIEVMTFLLWAYMLGSIIIAIYDGITPYADEEKEAQRKYGV